MNETSLIEILPTCVPRDISSLAAAQEKIAAFSPLLHLDINDGIFTESHSWPYNEPGIFEPKRLAGNTFNSGVEVHLMVADPRDIGAAFARDGAGRITAHVEAFQDAEKIVKTLDMFRSYGALQVGLAILIGTPLEALAPVIASCDVVQVMSIATIGAQGAPYDPRAVERVRELKTRYPNLTISVDGGVNGTNIADLVHAGARRFAVGSAIMKTEDPAKSYDFIQKTAENALQ